MHCKVPNSHLEIAMVIEQNKKQSSEQVETYLLLMKLHTEHVETAWHPANLHLKPNQKSKNTDAACKAK